MNFQETKENQSVHENNSRSTLTSKIRKLIYSFPLLKRIFCYMLKHLSFRRELLEFALKQESNGVKTFLNRQLNGTREWHEFFRERERESRERAGR
jgi:hypothetical protein